MAVKRTVRISAFVLLNFSIMALVLLIPWWMDDDCDSCVSMEKSTNIAAAEQRKTLVNRYRIISMSFAQPRIAQSIKELEFWDEHTRTIKADGSVIAEDTLLTWTWLEDPYQLRYADRKDQLLTGRATDYLRHEHTRGDTIELAVLLKEKVTKAELLYTKQQ